MLKPAADAAQCFGIDAQVSRDVAERHAGKKVRRSFHQVVVTLGGGFELRIYKPLFQPDIIFFITDPHHSFYFMVTGK